MGNGTKAIKLSKIESLNLFKNGIKPQWEDPKNKELLELDCALDKLTLQEGTQLWHIVAAHFLAQD